MFKKLLAYNWKLFRHSLTGTKIIVLLIYGLSLTLIFSQVISTVWLIISLQHTELSKMFKWYTPERGRFILLAFANILWLAQFFFTNVRLMRLPENRKLLTMGYPARKLSRYLTLMAFLHPMNLLFNISWFILLMLQLGSIYYAPLVLGIVILNFSLIFSAKFRILTVIKNYQKWLLVFMLSILIIASASVESLFSATIFSGFEQYLASANQVAALLPGGLIAGAYAILQPQFTQFVFLFFCGGICLLLHYDHVLNTRKVLQTRTNREDNRPLKSSPFRGWLCTQFGRHAGKYLYYVITHPYNKIQGLLFVAFPILYVPFLISRMDGLGSSKFLVLFFFMYAPMGFQLMFLGNMFGYEHRELLREMQFPILLKQQLKQRFLGALILPLTLLVIVSGAEFIILFGKENLLSIILGNILIFEGFLAIFLWSTFNRPRTVEWVSFSFTQPVISHSVQFITGFVMMLFSAAVYISYGTFEIYKQWIMIAVILGSGLGIYRYINNIQHVFTAKITPDLWTEL